MAETKLLHTLHWMLLEAAQECNHEPSLGHGWSAGGSSSSSAFLQPVGNQGSSPGAPPGSCSGSAALGGSGPQNGSSLLEEDENALAKLFNKSMATVELFVFLFAPLIHRIKVWIWARREKPAVRLPHLAPPKHIFVLRFAFAGVGSDLPSGQRFGDLAAHVGAPAA